MTDPLADLRKMLDAYWLGDEEDREKDGRVFYGVLREVLAWQDEEWPGHIEVGRAINRGMKGE